MSLSQAVANLEKRRVVLRKFYGGKRTADMHDFDENTGICKHCRTFIGDATMRLCSVITPDEVNQFRVYEG